MKHDVIGDIHGHADALVALLRRLGYRERDGAWRHPDRQAIFVGDFIDRGPQQVETVELVRAMVDAGSALAVMGNHEFNAIAWFLEDPAAPGEYLRPHGGELGHSNRRQHAAFLTEVEHRPALHRELVEWFGTLPLWLELPGLRVVHACWHDGCIAELEPRLRPGRRLDDSLVEAASRRDSPEFRAVETLTKGPEAALPAGAWFHDKDGHRRERVRTRWWDRDATTFREAAMLSGDWRGRLPDSPLPPGACPGYDGVKPVLVGHYWQTGEPCLLSPTVACVDYSVGKGGPLVAYRWEGEPTLDARNFVTSH